MTRPYPRPSLAARLYHLEVDETAALLVTTTVQAALNSVHTAAAVTPALEGRRYACQKWLLVKEDRLPQPIVLVTRIL